MVRLLFVMTLAVLGFASWAFGQVRQPVGYYVMQGLHQTNVNDQTMSSPKLTGFHLRDRWRLVHPTVSTWDWSYFDQQLARAARLGKRVTIGIYCGSNSPKWFNFKQLIDEVPLPWSDLVLRKHKSLVTAFANRYRNHPLIDAVHLSSTIQNDSLEMHYPQGLTSVPGYSDALAIQLWREAIDDYARAFPDKTLVLDIAPVANYNNPAVMRAAIVHLQSKPNRSFIHCSLKEKTLPTAVHHKTILDLSKAGEYVGFEMVGPSNDGGRTGNFLKALAVGAPANPKWHQIYQYDIQFLK